MKTPTLPLLACSLSLLSPLSAERTDWFQEARFGMFIHWGVYAVPAGEWQGKPVKGIGEWIMKNGKIPVADYKNFAKDFTASRYDPKAWARLARQAGMKYVVITSKHHDGFALYDSQVTEWDVTNSGAKRDLLAPLASAVRAEGLKFGLYYSQAQDWTHPGGAKYGGSTQGWDPTHEGDYDQYLKTIALPQAGEIINAYQPDILWWDTPVDMTEERVKPFTALMARHPQIINNNRLGKGFEGDTMTPEQHIPPRGYPGKMFEVCMTMNDTWGFKKDDHRWKSTRELLQNLSDIASKGGNFLLNVGPTAEGLIPQESIDRLQAIGRWMDTNAEAIHGTQASPFPRRLPWGRITRKATAKGGTTLYLHVWNWPADGLILLPTLKELPVSGKLLANGAAVTVSGSADGVIIQLPGPATDSDISVVRLDFPGSLTITQQPFVTAAADGSITLTATDADTHGGYSGNIKVEGQGMDAYLSSWDKPELRVEYQINTEKAGPWKIKATLAAVEDSSFVIKVGKKETPATVSATGPGLTWKSADLGTIELPSGEFAIEIIPDKKSWKPIHLRSLVLTPAAH